MESPNDSDLSHDEINIFMKVSKTISLKVMASERIKDLKRKLHERAGICEHFQEIFFTGERLMDDQKLVDYGIQNNSTLHLVLQNSVAMELFVNIPAKEKIIMVEAKIYDTLGTIKSLVEAKEGIQVDIYTLYYAGEKLEDYWTLASLDIPEKSMLYLILNPRDVLSVSVNLPSGIIVNPKVKILYTVGDLKAILASLLGFPVYDHNLMHAGQQLDYSRTLASYNITEESILELVPSRFQIFIKHWSGKTITLEVCQDDLVEHVMERASLKSGMPKNAEQGLVFGGRSLINGRDLASYGIQRDSTLHAVLMPRNFICHMPLSEVPGAHLINHSTKVGDLKAIISKESGSAVRELLFRGKALQDHVSIADYGIGENTVLGIVPGLLRSSYSS